MWTVWKNFCHGFINCSKFRKFPQERQPKFWLPNLLSSILKPKKARNENLQKHILSNCDSSLDLSGNLPSWQKWWSEWWHRWKTIERDCWTRTEKWSKKDANTENKMLFIFFLQRWVMRCDSLLWINIYTSFFFDDSKQALSR